MTIACKVCDDEFPDGVSGSDAVSMDHGSTVVMKGSKDKDRLRENLKKPDMAGYGENATVILAGYSDCSAK